MAKRHSPPKPCTLAPAGGLQVLQPIDVSECALLLACAVGRAVVFSMALQQERASEKEEHCISDAYRYWTDRSSGKSYIHTTIPLKLHYKCSQGWEAI